MHDPQPGLYDLSDKIAIVTGGGTGLGKVSLPAAGSRGMKVAICSRNAAHIDPTVTLFEQDYPGQVMGGVCDVSNDEQVSEFVEVGRIPLGSGARADQ